MPKSHKLQRAAIEVALDKTLKYIYKDPYPNLQKMAARVGKIFGGLRECMDAVRFKPAARC